MKKLIILSALIFTSMSFTGCVGLVVFHPREKTTTQFCLGSRGNLTNGPAASAFVTESEVLQNWGKPDTIRTNANHVTVWHYQGVRNWSIVLPAYFIGLPMPVATGHNHVDLYFADGMALKARGTVNVVSGLMLGVFPPTCVLACEKEPEENANGFIAVGYGFKREETALAPQPPAPAGGTNLVSSVFLKHN
jgi:hypothetical protein